jgi:hypothetical protein
MKPIYKNIEREEISPQSKIRSLEESLKRKERVYGKLRKEDSDKIFEQEENIKNLVSEKENLLNEKNNLQKKIESFPQLKEELVQTKKEKFELEKQNKILEENFGNLKKKFENFLRKNFFLQERYVNKTLDFLLVTFEDRKLLKDEIKQELENEKTNIASEDSNSSLLDIDPFSEEYYRSEECACGKERKRWGAKYGVTCAKIIEKLTKRHGCNYQQASEMHWKSLGLTFDNEQNFNRDSAENEQNFSGEDTEMGVKNG